MKVTIYNKTLNPELWLENKTLKPEVRVSLLKIAYTFYKETELKVHIRDILFLGSSANYNWTDTSDLDLHLLIDFNDLRMSQEAAKDYTKLITKKWNEEQDINIKGHKVEVYIQDVQEQNQSTGVYSLKTNKWIKEALPQNIVLDRHLIQQKYTNWVNKINNAINSNNISILKKIMDDLVKMRQTGLKATGEFSTENIVFKILRQRNIIKKLKDSIIKNKDKILSLSDGFDPTSFGPNPASTEGLPEKDYYEKQNSKMRKM